MREGVLEVGGLVELLVVVDAEGNVDRPRGGDSGAGASDLGVEEAGLDRGHDGVGAEAVPIRDFNMEGVAGDFGVVPVDGEEDGRVAEDGEVEGVASVLPDVLAAEDKVFA